MKTDKPVFFDRARSYFFTAWLTLLCFTGCVLFPGLLYAAPAGRGGLPGTAAGVRAGEALKARLDAVLAFKPRLELSPELTSLMANKALLRSQVRVAVMLTLLRLARYHCEKRRDAKNFEQAGYRDPELEQAVAGLFDVEGMAPFVIETVEYAYVFKAGNMLSKAMGARFAARTLPRQLALKLIGLGPVLIAWATANGLLDQLREGRFEDGISEDDFYDLVSRVGHEVLVTFGVVVAFRVLGYGIGKLAALAGRSLAGTALQVALKAAAARIAVVCGAVLTGLTVVGWVVGVAMLLAPVAKWAVQRMREADIRGGTGSRIRYRNQLFSLVRTVRETGRDDRYLRMSPLSARILLASYNSGKGSERTYAPSKLELFEKWGHTNNAVAERIYAKIRKKYALIDKEMGQARLRPGRIERWRKDIEELRTELREVFDKKETRSWTGTRNISELQMIDEELDFLEGIGRASGNTRYYSNDIRRKLGDLAYFARLNPGVIPGARPTYVLERPQAPEEVDELVRGLVADSAEEMFRLKQYLLLRREAIKQIMEGPTEAECKAESTLLEAIFEALRDLMDQAKSAVRPASAENGPSMNGINIGP